MAAVDGLSVLFLSRAAQASFVLARHLVPLSVVSDRPKGYIAL